MADQIGPGPQALFIKREQELGISVYMKMLQTLRSYEQNVHLPPSMRTAAVKEEFTTLMSYMDCCYISQL